MDDFLGFTTRHTLVSNTNGQIAWLERTRGVTNVALLVGGRAQLITSFAEDEGYEVSSLFLGSKRLLFTRGLSSGSNGAHLASPLSTATYSIDLDSPSFPVNATKLGDHELAGATSDGESALFAMIMNSGLTVSYLATSLPSPTPSVLFRTLTGSLQDGCGGTGLAWSPDGQTLALSSSRFDHAFVGLWRRGWRRITWLDPSVDVDACPTWSPDGRSLAFVRLRPRDASQALLHEPPPFSLMVADVAPLLAGRPPPRRPVRRIRKRTTTGVAVRVVLRDTLGYPGGGDNGYGVRPLLWSADGAEVLVGSERSGFTHVLAANASGDVAAGTDAARDLTPVECEHQDWVLGGVWLFVASTCVAGNGSGSGSLSIDRVDTRSLARHAVTPPDPHAAAGMASPGAGMLALPNGGLAFVATAFNSSTRVHLWTPPAQRAHGSGDGGGGGGGGGWGGGGDDSAAGRTTLLSAAADPPAFARFVRPTPVSFPSLDGTTTLHGQLFMPQGGVPTTATTATTTTTATTNHTTNHSSSGGRSGGGGGAAAIFTHGGSQRQMYASVHYGEGYAQLYALNQRLALDLGIPVLSINYRSGVGYGRDFRLCLLGARGNGNVAPGEKEAAPRRCGWRGGLEYDDVRAGRAWLRATLAPARVGIHGLSYGGLNCLQALSRDPADYAAGACNAPVLNWVSQTRFDGGTQFDDAPPLGSGYRQLPVGPEPTLAGPSRRAQAAANLALAWGSSPVSHLANISGPLLLIHGDLDQEVAVQESMSLARALRDRGGKAGANVRTLAFPGECHGECAYENQLAAAEATADFLVEHLKP